MLYISHSYGKGKCKYSVPGNLWYCIKNLWEWKKISIFLLVLGFIPYLIGNYAATVLPAVVVRDLERQSAFLDMALHIGGLSLIMWIGQSLDNGAMAWFETSMPGFLHHFRKKFTAKVMDLDYDILEAKESRDIIGNVAAAIRHGRGLYMVPDFLINGSSCVVLLTVYGFLIAKVNIWLLAVVMVTVSLDYILISVARKKYGEYHGENSQYALRTDYISTQAMESSAGKDIRLYHLLGLFLTKYEEAMKGMDRLFGRIHFWYQIRGIVGSFLSLSRNGIIYGVLVYFLMEGRLNVSELVYYVTLLNTFAGCFNRLVYLVMGHNSANMSIDYIRGFLSWENQWKEEEASLKPEKSGDHAGKPAKLEFRHVWFAYPGSTKQVLKDVNLTLHPGEKLALLGLNGAGKTTFVKLICGFYQPAKGEILFNDRPVRSYQREEYYKMLAVSFQDNTILPLSLEENLTGSRGEEIEEEKFHRALTLSGFWERYQRLPKKGKSRVVREVQKNSVDFSGGEYQKLLFARALYKEAPLVILDEPTAALDPIAEDQLYQNFSQAMKGATAVYISHRLSSTRFCDRIVLLENGRITEEGTHEELMKAGGSYARLYEMQSKYYA